MRRRLAIAFCLCATLVIPAASSADVQLAQTINISSKIAEIGGVPASVRISDVSTEALAVVGMFSRNKVRFDDWQVFRYTQARGIEDLGQIAKGINTLCVSADGTVIWGSYFVQNEGSHLFRFTPSQGIRDLGTLGREAITPYAASADGSVVVGSFLYATTAEKKLLYHAFKYSESNGFEDLGAMGAESAFARGVSADGSVVVGNFHVTNSNDHAFRYSHREGVLDIGAVGGKTAFAKGISNDGVIVGTFFASFDFYWQRYHSDAFLYSKTGGLKKLGAFGGTSVGVVRISPNATRIVGSYTNSARESHVFVSTIR